MSGASAWPEEFAAAYRGRGYWRGESFGALLRQRAAADPENVALICGERRFRYAELDSRVDRLAAGLLRLGLHAGDRVIVQLTNVAEFVLVCFALFRVGAAPIMALPAHRRSEISYLAAFSRATAYVIPDVRGRFDYRQLAAEVRAGCAALRHVIVAGEPGGFVALDELSLPAVSLPDRRGDELLLFQLSGGTTGVPKLIPRTHDDYAYSIRQSVEVCQVGKWTRYLAILPAAHNFTLSSPGVLGVLFAGGTVVMSESGAYDRVSRLMDAHAVTMTAAVPPLALAWVEAAQAGAVKPATLELLQVGGAKLSAELAARITPALGCRLQQVFGMAEGLVCYTRPGDPAEIVLNTQGRPMSPADEIRVVDDADRDVVAGEAGHLLTRGPYTIRGYYEQPEHNARAFTGDGFYRTGDIVRVTPSGYLVVEGRAKDLVNRGGDKVSAEELEAHLAVHPAVRDSAVVAMPDEVLGERTCVFAVVSRPLLLPELRRWLRERGLADYKLPDRLEQVESLPTTSVGKINKRELRSAIAAQLTREAHRPGDSPPRATRSVS